jgi:glycerophosphoryl diester phosphodiesterase
MKNRRPPHSFWANDSQKLVIVAHRGGDAAGIKKENSLRAFQAAYDLGYRWFETDVVPTSDRRLLAIHGRGYQRHPNADLPSRLTLQRLSYEEVKSEAQIGGEVPVLLTELLDTFTDSKFFVDPKTYKAASVLAEVLAEKPDYLDRVCVASFLPFNTSRVRRMVFGLTGENVAVAILGPLRGWILRLAALSSWLAPLAKYHISLAKTDSIHIPFKWVTGNGGQRFLTMAHTLGLKVAVYTPNEAVDLISCRDKGVDIIMSDKIERLSQIAGEK